jgi:hypothetical protein
VAHAADERAAERTARRAARETIGAYHREQLRALLKRVRTALAELDAGRIDEFEVDDVIYHYKRSAAALWKFCGSTGTQWEQAVATLALLRERAEEPDWWQAGAPRTD